MRAILRRALHDLRRIVVLSAIVIFAGAMSCTIIEDGILFAPGYGYVITVEHGPKSEHTLYVFETKEAAEKWAFNFQQTPSKPQAMKEPGYTMKVAEDSQNKAEEELFWKIWRARVPIPPPSAAGPTRSIDEVVPPVPTAPAPR